MTWRKRKIGELVDKFSVRAKDVGGVDGLIFFGVSNEMGIIKTKYAAEDKAEDYKIIEQYCFAYNPYRVNVGSIGMVRENIRGLISPAYVVFKPKPNSIKAELLLKFLKSSEGLRQIRFYARGTVRQALRFEDLCNIELSLPDFDEQESLVEKLNFIGVETGLLNSEFINQQDLLKKLRQAFLKEAMQGKMVEQDEKEGNADDLLKNIKNEKKRFFLENNKKGKDSGQIIKEEFPFSIPENWVWCTLEEITSLITSGSRSWNKYYSKEGALFIRSQNIKPTHIDLTNKVYVKLPNSTEGKRTSIQKDDILITITGAGVSNAGILRDIKFDEGYISQHVALIRLMMKDIASWVHFCITSDVIGKAQFSKLIYGDKPGLNLIQLNTLIIPLPPLSEQIRIIKKLDEAMSICDEIANNITQSKAENELLIEVSFNEALGIKPTYSFENDKTLKHEIEKSQTIDNSIDRVSMKIIEILQKSYEPISATALWNSSEYAKNIEGFYAELKQLIDIEKLVVEEKIGKESFLKLVGNED